MKDEEIDWIIYHHIGSQTVSTVDNLIGASGLDPATVRLSLQRLEKSFLIERGDSIVRVLNVGESLLKNQLRFDKSTPYTIENGVIKVKQKE